MNNKSTIVILILLLVLGVWYYYAPARSDLPTQTDSISISAGDKTADIQGDFSKTPDDSAATKELDSLDQNLQSF